MLEKVAPGYLREKIIKLRPPVLHFLSEKNPLVPPSKHIPARFRRAEVVIQGASHSLDLNLFYFLHKATLST